MFDTIENSMMQLDEVEETLEFLILDRNKNAILKNAIYVVRCFCNKSH